jgi:hypothetical protein
MANPLSSGAMSHSEALTALEVDGRMSAWAAWHLLNDVIQWGALCDGTWHAAMTRKITTTEDAMWMDIWEVSRCTCLLPERKERNAAGNAGFLRRMRARFR